ncbi:MAG: hypothetical protein V4618_01500 [Pseudomonadota bacterium]
MVSDGYKTGEAGMAVVSRFDIIARRDPQTLSRLINYFAQRAMIPRAVQADECDGMMMVMIEQEGLLAHEAGVIADKMRMSWLVDDVKLRCGQVQQLPLNEAVIERAA